MANETNSATNNDQKAKKLKVLEENVSV